MSLLLLPIALSLALAAQDEPEAVDEAPAEVAQQAETEPEEGAIPWQAQIYSAFEGWTPEQLENHEGWNLAHKCGGTLIAPGWVLTAAHCINQKRIELGHRVRLGADYIDNDEGVTYHIDRMVRHADWNQAQHAYDIALVHFVADAKTNADKAGPVEQIALYDGPPLQPGTNVFASGWGKAEEGKDVAFEAELTSVDLQTVDCGRYPQYSGLTQDYQLCATGRTPGDDADTCTGDSGGPLILDGDRPVLVGIVNWGFGCYREDSAGVYIRIDRDHFRDWIDRAMAADPAISELR
jgi:secreted trypsin-like serine protease